MLRRGRTSWRALAVVATPMRKTIGRTLTYRLRKEGRRSAGRNRPPSWAGAPEDVEDLCEHLAVHRLEIFEQHNQGRVWGP